MPEPKAWTSDYVMPTNAVVREGQRYKTYMSKKRYAEGIMGIAAEYKGTKRVIGVDFWKGVVEGGGKGTCAEFEESGMWPGCGLVGAKEFDDEWFTDGLHLDMRGYRVLSRMLMNGVLETWPDLAPNRL
jgi:hypothetical protein